MKQFGKDYLSKLLNVGDKQEKLPKSIVGSHTGLILTKKDFYLCDSA